MKNQKLKETEIEKFVLDYLAKNKNDNNKKFQPIFEAIKELAIENEKIAPTFQEGSKIIRDLYHKEKIDFSFTKDKVIYYFIKPKEEKQGYLDSVKKGKIKKARFIS